VLSAPEAKIDARKVFHVGFRRARSVWKEERG